MLRKWLQKLFKSNPHEIRVQELRVKLKKYQELAEDAYKLGDAEAYRAIETMIRETFMELMTASFCAGLYSLLPHIILIWLLSFLFGPIHVGNYQIGILLWYPAIVIPIYLIYKKLRNTKANKNDIVQGCTN
ncbi:hypothetical protein [Desulfolucanica intricata]|uniref:hypothetical protein n=1 Tax=Desulfolucanica intricata TaxID=1285191 RepID=UPI00082CA3F1|nr:hypothetical protein [Desulfolucanica intricata]